MRLTQIKESKTKKNGTRKQEKFLSCAVQKSMDNRWVINYINEWSMSSMSNWLAKKFLGFDYSSITNWCHWSSISYVWNLSTNRFVTIGYCIVSNFTILCSLKWIRVAARSAQKDEESRNGKNKTTKELFQTFISNRQCSVKYEIKKSHRKNLIRPISSLINGTLFRPRKDCQHHLQTSFFRQRSQQ